MDAERTLERVLSGTADAAIRLGDMCQLLEMLGFREARTGQPLHIPEERRGGKDQFAGSGRERIRSTGPGGHPEGKAGVQAMTKYEVIIYWSEEDEAFVAEVLELPGCAAHGATQDGALSNAQDAIRLWIDTAKEFGDPVPEPKGRRLLRA